VTEVQEQSVIDGRYRVLRHVGSGGMADVYSAVDLHLGRTVALKLLHRRFAQDKEFVERFRREASAAAGLQHPNVVSVYDRGEFDGTSYIAMEFCEGSTLREVITRNAPLDLRRAIDITRKILVAARFAHRRGVIHRDLKPHNVIVDSDGGTDDVKVTDFGIARAGASEITEVGAIMGTAHYLSPEQAQGRPVTAASDLYSVGVVLYEMLTGRPPFEGDSAVAIALKHVSQPPPSPRELRPEIPPELEAVVLKALAKDADSRYGEADAFIHDLGVVDSLLAEDGRQALERTAMFAPVEPSEAVAAGGPPATAALPASATPTASTAPSASVPDAPPSPEVAAPEWPPPAYGEPEGGPPGKRRRRGWIWVVALTALAAILAGGFALLRPDQARVPDVRFQTLDRARQELEGEGFKVDIERRSDPAPVDTVIGQAPRAGEEINEGSVVTLQVSNGPSTVKVPDVVGLSERDARRRVESRGLEAKLERESSTKVLEGAVIRSDPGPGIAIERGSRVTLFLSTGPEQVTVPDVVGQGQEDAVSRLGARGLNVLVRERASSEPVDTVLAQSPSAGQEVDEGSSVTLFVSNGRLEEVPDVVGLDQDEAEADLGDAGFRVSVRAREVEEPDREGRVLSQTPSGGREQRKGSTVVITVGALPAPEESPPPGPGEGGE
jgi:beta-lactam-binding protein with PASTA domain